MGCFWVLAVRAAPGTLVVGKGGLPWSEVEESAQFVQMSADSLWTWSARPGENLSTGIRTRGGSIHAIVEERGEKVVVDLPALESLVDGDEGTAFNPDEVGVPRQVDIYIDLGGIFRLSRVRLFPRLDSQHRLFFPSSFSLVLQEGSDDQYAQLFEGIFSRTGPPTTLALILLGDGPYISLLYFSPSSPNNRSVVDWPGTRQISGVRQARYVRLQTLLNLPWELAELELYSDGTVPEGEFVSRPLEGKGNPVWGRVQYEGGDLAKLPLVLQTRTGPDGDPVHYFLIDLGEREIPVSREAWMSAISEKRSRPNPEWSAWQSVEEGVVRSPSPNRFIQFRLRVLDPGVKVESLAFEYDTRPLAHALWAEVTPLAVEAGQETTFILSAMIANQGTDTGFRYLQVLTPAQLVGVDSVRVNGQPITYTVTQNPGQGITLNLWERLRQDESLFQVYFRARVFADGTPFNLRALDRRLSEAEEDTAYQYASEADVDPLSLGASLVVRLNSVTNPLLTSLQPRYTAFTPNGDGVNDLFVVEYSVLKLTRPAPVYFEIFDLSGLRVRQGYIGADLSGQYTRIWDGRDDQGLTVGPGLYLYRIQVQSDAGTTSRQGVVNVVY